jgi:hydrophobe/amphiphile efflux-1 (HAE1) family protein
MNLSAIAIRRPVFTVMCAVALLVMGIVGFKRLGTDLFPDVSFPVVVVNVPYPGASPSEVETLVVRPLEDSVVSLNGIDRVKSFSRESLGTVVILFKLGVNITEAAADVRDRIAQTRFKLPADVKEPSISRLDVSATPILIYTLRGQRPLSELRKLADDVLKPQLEQVEGVASVQIKGGAAREIQVELDRAKMDALRIDPSVVSARLRAANLTVPAGHFDEGAREISVRTVGELPDAEAVRNVVIANAQDGSAVRLRDVASVTDGYEELRTRIRANGEQAVSFEVQKQSGRNSVAVADALKERLAQVQSQLPPDIKPELLFDQSVFIRENAHEVEIAIVFGGAMAILVILLFMLDLRSTLISAVALPTSVIGTFFVMYALGYTLNMMTLLGLSLAIGLLIDDAVVVRENIFKHLERGQDPFTAALEGTKEIALSVLATTLTIVAVFAPVAFMDGIVGQFFRQFGITVSASVLISLVVAFTLDPMLSSRFSKTVEHGKPSRFDALKRPFELFFSALDRTYGALLHWAVRRKIAVAGLAFGSLVLMGWVAGLMGSEFVNAEDRGQFVVEAELPAGSSLDETARVSLLAEEAFLKHPQVRVVFAVIGPSGETNKVSWRVVTSKKAERPSVPLGDIKDAARKALADQGVPKVTVTDPAFVEGAATEAPIMISVRGTSYDEIVPAANKVEAVLKNTPGVEDIQVKYTPGRPELQVEIDRQRAAEQGVAVAQIAMALRGAIEGEEATKLRQGKDEIPVRVRLRPEDRNNALDLERITLSTPRGPVKLLDVARLVRGEGPQVIEREDRQRQITIWASPKGRPLGDISTEIKPKIAGLGLPTSVSVHYDGQIKQMEESNSSMGVALLLGVIFIYLVLASQFESFIHPLTIMLTLPLALVGAILGLFVTNNTMAMGAMIGIILLMGLVTKNAILLVDRAIVRVREQGESPLQAILEAGPERLRPILMTSAAMVLGMLPTAVNQGDGSEFRAPMAIAVIGGVVSSTLLSLIVVPVFYLAIEDSKDRLRRLRAWLSSLLGRKAEALSPRRASPWRAPSAWCATAGGAAAGGPTAGGPGGAARLRRQAGDLVVEILLVYPFTVWRPDPSRNVRSFWA